MSTNFVLKELAELEVTEASGPDGITARLLKDVAPVIAKPITYLVNLTISTGLIPAEWKDARVTSILNQEQGTMLIITDQSQFFPWCKRLWSTLFKYNSWLF